MSSSLKKAVLHAASKTITDALDEKLVTKYFEDIEAQRKMINLIWLFLDQETKSGRLSEFVDQYELTNGE